MPRTSSLNETSLSPRRQSSRQLIVLDRRYWLVADVRFDRRADLLADLAKHPASSGRKCHGWGASSPCLAALGAACLQRIIGDFSFALHDASRKMPWCVRDFVGTRPFFYSHLGKVFAFSNVSFLAYGHAAMRGYVDRRHCFASSRTGLTARKAVRRSGWCAAHALSGTATIRECVGNSCANSTGSRRREGRSRSQPVSPSCSMVAASWLCAARFVAATFRLSMPGEGLAGAGYLLRLSLSPTDEDLAERCGGGPLVAPGRSPAAFTTDQEVWAGPLSPSLLNRKATKKPARG